MKLSILSLILCLSGILKADQLCSYVSCIAPNGGCEMLTKMMSPEEMATTFFDPANKVQTYDCQPVGPDGKPIVPPKSFQATPKR